LTGGSEFGGTAGGGGRGGEHLSFMMRMEKLEDENLTNLCEWDFLPVNLVVGCLRIFG